ncbi:geranylgeranyl pyrophosphate synthase, partial [Brachionus plicatilis]
SKMEAFSYDNKLLEPLTYLRSIPGKKIRTKLIQSFNHWLSIPEDKLSTICEIIELLHNSSLLIDDIEDHSDLRRGLPAAHKVFGVPLTINCANLAYFQALRKCIDLGEPKIVPIFTDQLIELHRGQGMDIWFRDNYQCPSEEQYFDLIKKKTGGLFKLAVLLMKCYSSDCRDFNTLMEPIGMFFQIRDDLANLTSKEYSDSKSFCEDLTEGKFSYPIVKYFQKEDNTERMMEILKKRTCDVEVKKEAICMLEEKECFKMTNLKLIELKKVIFDEIRNFGGNQNLEMLFNHLSKIVDK